ncbi:branched-chain amino acid ABC transporter permease [Halobacteriales archaeon QS_1_68_20]|nr:MAG: branched-chain amino acid ABC transporter permease [Halobacteriales archaeon QS_1_68_20]
MVYSSIIVLGSIGLSLVYDIADFPNFAHGDLMAVGAFGALAVHGSLGFPFPVAVVTGMVIGAVVAVLTNRVVFEPMDAGPLELLIASIGVALIYRAALMQRFGTESQSYDVGGQAPIDAAQETLGIAINVRAVAIIAVTLVLVGALHAMLQYTSLGRQMRATSANPSLARVSGIRTDRVVTAMWVIGGALAAAGGVFLGLHTLIRPRMGFDILLVLFAAVILGGIGSVYGAMAGGLVIGMVHELTPAIPVVPTRYNTAIAFVIMILILLVQPSGIAGGKTSA